MFVADLIQELVCSLISRVGLESFIRSKFKTSGLSESVMREHMRTWCSCNREIFNMIQASLIWGWSYFSSGVGHISHLGLVIFLI